MLYRDNVSEDTSIRFYGLNYYSIISKFTNILNLDETLIFTSLYEVLRIETIIEKVYKGGNNVLLVI